MKYIYDDKKLNYIPYVEKWGFLKYLGLILLSIIMFFMGTVVSGPALKVNKPVVEVKEVPFSEENLKQELEKLCINHPEIVLKQAKLETGNFKSELFLKAHNLFGMKIAKIRPRLQRGNYKIGSETYAKYNTWQESVLDYALWQSSQCSHIDSVQVYLSYLGEHYAADKNYINKLNNIEI